MSGPGPLFGIVPAGHPLITEPTSGPEPTSFLYSITSVRPFSHLAVFLLPGVALPPDTAAAIYLSSAKDVAAASAAGQTPNFTFVGGVGPGKESTVLRINNNQATDAAERAGAPIVVGISLEPAGSVAARIEELSSVRTTAQAPNKTVILAQRIIQNAFNFLASFSGTAGPDGVEVVPLKAFEEWWRKFEGRVRSDPSFLEKQSD